MAPEQATGAARPDARADSTVWAPSPITLLTGRPPFAGPTAMAVMIGVAHDPVEPPSRHRPGCPPTWSASSCDALPSPPPTATPTPRPRPRPCRLPSRRRLELRPAPPTGGVLGHHERITDRVVNAPRPFLSSPLFTRVTILGPTVFFPSTGNRQECLTGCWPGPQPTRLAADRTPRRSAGRSGPGRRPA